jgi:heterodisulfide reductase subunit A
MANQGFDAYVVEKENELGGALRHIHYLLNGENPQAELAQLKEKLRKNSRVHVFTNANIAGIEGTIGDFRTKISANGESTEVGHGVVIVATGAKEYTPQEYLYGEDERVVTQRQLEQELASGNGFLSSNGDGSPKTVVMIQCVGSRDTEHPYCSRVCCTDAIKNALRIKKVSPETHVYVLYRDIRTYGLRETYYTQARQKGVAAIRKIASPK